MKNKSYHKHNWHISWFDIKNESEDSYLKACNKIYQENQKSYFRKIFHFLYKEWGIFRDSENISKKVNGVLN